MKSILSAIGRYVAVSLIASAPLFAGGAPDDPVPTPGACASGVVTQQFYDRVAGCAGTVARKDAATLCSPGFTLATGEQWRNAHHQLKPLHHYWLSDKLDRDTDRGRCVGRPAGRATDCGDTAMHVCAAGADTDAEGNHCGVFDCGWNPSPFDEVVPDQYLGGCTAPDTTAGALCAGPPPSWDQLQIDIMTGEDEARSSSEITADVIVGTSIQHVCLKPSDSLPSAGLCPNGPGAPGWSRGSAVSIFFTVPAQTSLTGFATLLIKLAQGPCFGCTSDNWNIEAIKVTARDTSKVAPPRVLLDLGSGGRINADSCVARLKDAPNATMVTFSLSPGMNSHVYADGNAKGLTTTCMNNGG